MAVHAAIVVIRWISMRTYLLPSLLGSLVACTGNEVTLDSLDGATLHVLSQTYRSVHTSYAFVDLPLQEGSDCPVLGDSFAGTYGGLPMKRYTPETPMENGCYRLGLQLVGKTGELDSAVVEVHDASHTMTATFANPDDLESRSFTHVPSTDQLNHLRWSHPTDLIGASPRITWSPNGEAPGGWFANGTVEGDEIIYTTPPNIPQPTSIGWFHYTTKAVTGTAESCTGAAACTYDFLNDA